MAMFPQITRERFLKK
uniref:Uncharacterized protein n=1 Tax=Arundo donax TaxID=35708 RepID=A0A0A9B0Q2_ARUDO